MTHINCIQRVGVVAVATIGWLSVAGCSPPPRVLVVGDESAQEAAAKLQELGVAIADENAAIESATLIVVAQDALQSLSPIHKQLVNDIARSKNQRLLWVLTNSYDIDDVELLELQELEARDLLNAAGLPGDELPFAVDSETAAQAADSPNLKGWQAIAKYAKEQAQDRKK